MCTSSKIIIPLAALLACFLMLGCSKSDDQKEFENQAYSTPENYTAMNANGRPAGSGQTDPNDWRISPMYQGLLDVHTKAYPNPVFINSSFRILISINYIVSNLSRIEAHVFQTSFQTDNYGPLDVINESEISEGALPTLNINASSLPTSKREDNLYRIVLFDQAGNIITYGDVKVEE